MRAILAGFMGSLVLVLAASARAQPMMGDVMRGRPPFLENLFPPRLIMRYQGEIELTEEQRKAITEAMGEAEAKVVDLRWQFEAESQKLTNLMERERVDEKEAMAQAEKVMALEQKIKREHLALLIRVKNQLSASQQEKLRSLRAEGMTRKSMGRGRGGMP